MKTYFNFIKVNVYNFFAVCTNFCNLSIKINRVSTTRATCNNQANHLCFLFHYANTFQNVLNLNNFRGFEFLHL